jgi:hypothetical protein
MDGAGIKQEEGIGGHPPLFPQPRWGTQHLRRAGLPGAWWGILNENFELSRRLPAGTTAPPPSSALLPRT